MLRWLLRRRQSEATCAIGSEHLVGQMVAAAAVNRTGLSQACTSTLSNWPQAQDRTENDGTDLGEPRSHAGARKHQTRTLALPDRVCRSNGPSDFVQNAKGESLPNRQ